MRQTAGVEVDCGTYRVRYDGNVQKAGRRYLMHLRMTIGGRIMPLRRAEIIGQAMRHAPLPLVHRRSPA